MNKKEIQDALNQGVKEGKMIKFRDKSGQWAYKLTEKGRLEAAKMTGSPRGFLTFLMLTLMIPPKGKKDAIDWEMDANTFIRKMVSNMEPEVHAQLVGNGDFLRTLQSTMEGRTVADLLGVIEELGVREDFIK